MRLARHRWFIAIAVLVALVLAASIAGFLWWRESARSNSEKRYENIASRDWRRIFDRANLVTVALLKVESLTDLTGVATEASDMTKEIAKIASERKKSEMPRGQKATVARESVALESLGKYLEMLDELALKVNAEELLKTRSLIEDRARVAQANVDDFLASARWLNGNITGDFYSAGSMLQAVIQPVDRAQEEMKSAVFEAVNAFMDADISRHDFDLIWAMLSSKLHMVLGYYKINKENLNVGWKKAWGDKKPVSFYVNKSQISFPGAGSAAVNVIVYTEKSGIRRGKVRLLYENGWKLDSYPFAGFG
ncbi:MAG: hypothetical protein CVT63_01860 [Candidatus Anoxymicrobium japonicum]|uniref:Uncharacterized protein n=1 Tax=Candidatus Anoxymicrobium japonicum TaxID=2013648 RepID=A0A2N3G7C2_9ACTN|nr:MAG: hypothetical protein CVT63_01860 [Candidatus Anoxymicrobium japonicum]